MSREPGWTGGLPELWPGSACGESLPWGRLGLGDWLAANEEFEEIEASWRAHPEVLAVRSRLYAAAGNYDEALMIAQAGVKFVPPEGRVEALCDLAVCASRLKRMEDARHWLGGGKVKAGTCARAREARVPGATAVSLRLASTGPRLRGRGRGECWWSSLD